MGGGGTHLVSRESEAELDPLEGMGAMTGRAASRLAKADAVDESMGGRTASRRGEGESKWSSGDSREAIQLTRKHYT